jgi:DNA-directed RNA polymerase subunit L
MSSPPHPISNKPKPKLKAKMALKPQLAINRAHKAVEALDYEEAEVV